MLLSLLRKDFLLVRRYVLIVFLIVALLPPVLIWREADLAPILVFMFIALYCVVVLLQYLLLKEYQCPKAAGLLCAVSFSRAMMVLSKYVFCLAVYAGYCLLYALETLLIPSLPLPDAPMLVFMLLLNCVFAGIFLPLQYKLGYEKTRFVFIVIVMASPILFPRLLQVDQTSLNFLGKIPSLPATVLMAALALMILAGSALCSVKLYAAADLG